jgi:hypothetical protein
MNKTQLVHFIYGWGGGACTFWHHLPTPVAWFRKHTPEVRPLGIHSGTIGTHPIPPNL